MGEMRGLYDMWSKLKIPTIALISAAIGAGGVIAYNHYGKKPEARIAANEESKRTWSGDDHFNSILKDQQKLFKNFDSMFDDDFFRREDPFEEMKKFRKRLMGQFGHERDSFFYSPFDSWYEDKFGGGSVEDISKREDDKYIYYDIKVAGVDGTKVNTTVKDGYLTISGEVKRSKGGDKEGEARSVFQSSFRRTFPLPENVDSENMEMLNEKNKIVLKFPKLQEPK